jgi:two-component system LytT family response regulator
MNNQYTSIIVDDEPQAVSLLKDSLEIVGKNIQVIQTYTSWKHALEGLRTTRCDLLFLDISMQGKNSMELLKGLPDLQTEIIFITAHSDFAIEAFQYAASGYILKPIDEVELARAIDRAVRRIQLKRQASHQAHPQRRIGIPDNKSINYFDIHDIVYLEAVGAYTRVVTKTREFTSAYNIGRFKELLPETAFFQPHRSFIVNQEYIRRYDTNGVIVLDNNTEIPVSRNNREQLLQLFARISGHDLTK